MAQQSNSGQFSMRRLLKLVNPSLLVAQHRKLLFKATGQIGNGLKVTHRSEVYCHGTTREQLQIGDHVVIDGTLEVYANGYLSLGNYVFVGRSRIYCANRVSIGNNVLISDNVCVMDSDLHPRSATQRQAIAQAWSIGKFPDVYDGIPSAPVTIESNCWLGYGCAILKGVTIGEGSIVGAGGIVINDVPPWTIVAGNPARVIREIPEHER